MALSTTQQVETWIQRHGGITRGLPRLRTRIKAGLLSPAEIAVVKEYLASLDTTQLSTREQAEREQRKRALASTLDEAQPAGKGANTVVVAVVAILAGLAAAVMIR